MIEELTDVLCEGYPSFIELAESIIDCLEPLIRADERQEWQESVIWSTRPAPIYIPAPRHLLVRNTEKIARAIETQARLIGPNVGWGERTIGMYESAKIARKVGR